MNVDYQDARSGAPEKKSQIFWRSLLVIFLLSLCARTMLPGIWGKWRPSQNEFYFSDAKEYDKLAWDLVEGRGYTEFGRPSSFRAPGLPFLLAGVYSVFGHSPSAAIVLLVFMSSLISVVAFIIALRLFGVIPAWIAGLLCVLNPGLIYYSHFLMTEIPCAFFLALAFLFMFAPSREGLGNWAWGGFFLGLTTLVRAFYFLLPPALVIWLLLSGWKGGNLRQGIFKSACLLFFFAMTLSPWTIRNAFVHNAFVPVSTQSGCVLFLSYDPPGGVWGGGYVQNGMLGEKFPLPELSEVEYNRQVTAYMKDWILSHPKEVARAELIKILFFFYPYEGRRYNIPGFFDSVYATLLFFLFTALLLRGGYLKSLFPVFFLFGYMLFFSLVFYASPRFNIPMLPILSVAVGSVVFKIWKAQKPIRNWVFGIWAIFIILGMITGPWVVGAYKSDKELYGSKNAAR